MRCDWGCGADAVLRNVSLFRITRGEAVIVADHQWRQSDIRGYIPPKGISVSFTMHTAPAGCDGLSTGLGAETGSEAAPEVG